MKKWCALLLALILALTQCLALAEEVFPEGEEAPRIPEGAEVLGHLTVGNPTPMRGEFFTDLWGNATSDIDVRDLLHGYNLIRWDGESGMFAIDASVVSDITVMRTGEGDHSYLLTLYNDLYYSDGTPITAWDYAFTYLLTISPQIAAIGGLPRRCGHLMGYQEYMDGTASALAGVRVLGDNVLMVTLDHEYLPFFYEMGLLSCQPYPISVIAPGVTVRDDGDGVYFEGELSAEVLRQTILDPETGYQSHPSAVSGPYTLTAWDGKTAEFAINPYYKGNYRGMKPVIETLTYTLADNADMAEKLASGTFDLLDKVTRQDSIQAGLALTAEGGFSMSSYPRVGLSYISFACEKPAMASDAVRRAIAWCLDRDAVTADYTGSYGIRVDGYYGVGQWMYGLVAGTTAPPLEEPAEGADRTGYEKALSAWEALSFDALTRYTLDTDAAAALLDQDGWQLNADGVREKNIGGQTVTLDLSMIYPEGNNINEVFEARLIPNLEKVGIRLTMQAVPMGELLNRWYKQGQRDADMIYLASNFDLVFDPSVQFAVDETGAPNWSYTNHTDAELYRLAEDMRRTEPGAVLEYVQKWLLFQERFNQTLPMLPVYSNVYFDFYTEDLHDFMIAESVTWSEAIVESALYAAPDEAAQAEEETIGD